MADRYQVSFVSATAAPATPSAIKKVERNNALFALKRETILKKKQEYKAERHALKLRTYKYESEYRKMREINIQNRREAKASGKFYKEADPKIVFIMRIKGINKLAPKPKKILQLYRLRQLHNGVFCKLNEATRKMLQVIEPFVTYGYPTLSTIRKLIYKRGYGKIGKTGAWSRVRLTKNEIISSRLGKYGIYGIEDLVHEIYTCGPSFKYAANFLWPFKLSSPRKGFVAKRHGFNEPRGGDWGNRDVLVNELINRMN